LFLDNGYSISSGKVIKSHSVKRFSGQIVCPVPEKRIMIPDNYSLLNISFRNPFKAEFRVYDDGVAYRILTSFRDSIRVKEEIATFSFPGKPSVFFPEVHRRSDADIFHTSFEEEYKFMRIDSIGAGSMAFTPVLVAPQPGPKIAITESDLEDYPGMFLTGTGSATFKATFAGYPLEEKATEGIYPQMLVTKRAPYIARTTGTRSFPWRVIIIAGDDRELPSNDLVYRLASPSRIGDPTWIKPGNLTDEWIIDLNLFNVPFRAGLNTESYKYYIDFAKRFGFDRIMMDAGWSDNKDLFRITPSINIDTLVAFAGKKGVKLSMWTLAMTLDRQLDRALDRFKHWGVDFIMTDFIDRDDQKAVNFYYRIAKACADRKIMIMFHGAFPPKGYNRTFPNAVAREGVLGSEYNIWSNRVTPRHDLTLPFTRMLAGGFDYEPGLLNNATMTGTRPVAGVVTSPGTRCHQLAMFVVYDIPMQIFSGNPSEGVR
ncbi:MAG: glycoside hydrolase family 97 catalytic domain-containing protein, partial [Bacteroidota bacterium]|nr:glycoside hydrolase family 97 catalytic domain-containing protein [Bacteroidota bacterium]